MSAIMAIITTILRLFQSNVSAGKPLSPCNVSLEDVSASNKPTALFLKPGVRQAPLAHESSTLPSLLKGCNKESSAPHASLSSEQEASDGGTLPPYLRGYGCPQQFKHVAVSSNLIQTGEKKSLSLKTVSINSPSVKILKALQAPKPSSNEIPSLSPDGSVPPCNSSSDHTTFKAVTISTPIKTPLSINTTVSQPSASTLPERSDEHIKSLQRLLNESLPANYSHEILSVMPLHVYRECDDTQMYEAIIRVNISTKEEALGWLADYQDCSFTDWRVRRTFVENSQEIIFKKAFRCHNITMAQNRLATKQAHKKHTECQAFLTLTVKNPEMKRSEDKHLKTHPME